MWYYLLYLVPLVFGELWYQAVGTATLLNLVSYALGMASAAWVIVLGVSDGKPSVLQKTCMFSIYCWVLVSVTN